MNPKSQTEAITFVAHGSRLDGANQFVLDQIGKLRADNPVNLGFLEMAQPALIEALKSHLQNGFNHIRIIPLFLAPGKHTLMDIPSVATQVSAEFPDAKITFEPFIGAHPDFLALLQSLL